MNKENLINWLKQKWYKWFLNHIIDKYYNYDLIYN